MDEQKQRALRDRVSGAKPPPPPPPPAGGSGAGPEPAEPQPRAGTVAALAPHTRDQLVALGLGLDYPVPRDLPDLMGKNLAPPEFRRAVLEMALRETQPQAKPLPSGVAAAAESLGATPSDEALAAVVNDYEQSGWVRPPAGDAAGDEPAPPANAAPPAAGGESPTGVGAERTVCPHCLYDLRLGPVPLASDADKEVFVLSLLTPFIKQYDLYDGRLRIRLRTLTRREVDAVHADAVALVREGDRQSKPYDPFESQQWVMRRRLALQLVWVAIQRPDGGFDERLYPEGLDRAAHKSCRTKTWDDELFGEQERPKGDDYLKTLFEGILARLDDELFVTESMYRVVDDTVREFNRLTAHLEAMRGAPDFLSRTPSRSG